ncbi:MAG TPA: nucleotidyl transferase AbiEii/AbiGii toxin family protein [Kofleriaceae bacterium]|nr:nucleotidyl transferase AbiEii/AbiGii toxin family protein [Kofleriaceae bacterium]
MSRFDRRIVPDAIVTLIHRLQRVVPSHLGGGAALAGAHLHHRLSRDVDLFCHDRAEHRLLVDRLVGVAANCGLSCQVVQDAGSFVRATLQSEEIQMEIDLVHEPAPDLAPPDTIEGIAIESLDDLRASKLTCILSRSEPRDLVDLYFLERAGFPPQDDLELALRKDGGIDPGVIAWLLGQFPVEPMPALLLPLSVDELRAYRDDLRERMRARAVPEE